MHSAPFNHLTAELCGREVLHLDQVRRLARLLLVVLPRSSIARQVALLILEVDAAKACFFHIIDIKRFGRFQVRPPNIVVTLWSLLSRLLGW